MVEALASGAIQRLRDLLIDEAKFLFSVSYQVELVERDLRNIHSLLIDADKWSGRKLERRNNWISDLQSLAFEAETVLEKYAVEVTSKKEGGTLKEKLKRFACILIECCSVHQVGKEVESIRSRLAYLTNELKLMSGGEGGTCSSNADQQNLLRQRFSHEVDDHFVGREEDIECLASMVKNKNGYKSPVVAICGMGGLGKTTLARKIYNREDVKGCFDAHAWVCVTQQLQPKAVLGEVLRKLLGEYMKEEINDMGHPELVEKIHNYMSQKECLVVVDDIWERDHWDILKPAFAHTNCKILLTTRNEHIVSQDCVHKLNFLTEYEGWELLRKIAVPDGQPGLKTFEDIGRQMVKKCGCLPLAISVVGGILRQNQTRAEWEVVSGNIDSYLKLGEGFDKNKRVIQVLDLSYDVLPYYLKPCFLYLACFPEDKEIETEELYLLWIAEGLISSQDKGRNETLRDVAERYLSELAFRCMVRVQKDEDDYSFGKFTSCRLHDLMRDLSLSKAEEINFIKRLSFSKQLYGERPSSIVTSSSRLVMCVEAGDSTILSTEGIQKLEDLKSLLILSKNRFDRAIVSRETIMDFGKSKGLRVLRLTGCQIEGGELLRNVDKLIHLRYLNLFNSNVKELPASICDMPYLETLDLRVMGIIKLPNVIYKIKKLRHLFLDYFSVIGGDKLILDGLKELETLLIFDFFKFEDILKLTNLRKLRVLVLDMESASILANYMCNNESLLRESRLTIKNCNFISAEGKAIFRKILMSTSIVYLEIDECKFGCGFSSYEQEMCRNLVHLDISKSMIEGDLMGILGKYPILRHLRVKWSMSQPNMICVAHSFPELKSLSLIGLDNLRKWEVEERAMPKLTELVIGKCINLEGLPLISTLRELLGIYDMPKEFNNKLRVVNGQPGEDYHKVSHIPFVHLRDLE